MSGERSVLIMLTVPAHWPSLSVRELTKKLREQPHLLPFLAKEVRRWGNRDDIDTESLQRVVDELKSGGAS